MILETFWGAINMKYKKILSIDAIILISSLVSIGGIEVFPITEDDKY